MQVNTESEYDSLLNKRALIIQRHSDYQTRKNYCLIDIEVAKLDGDSEKLRASMCELLELEASICKCEREVMKVNGELEEVLANRVNGELEEVLANRRMIDRERERAEKSKGSLWGRFLLFIGWK